MRKTMLRNTNSTAPKNFAISIWNLDKGFDSIRSIVPFSVIDGKNEADDIKAKNTISGNDIIRKPTCTVSTIFRTSASEASPSMASWFIRIRIVKMTMA
jgi:hypothetical protein